MAGDTDYIALSGCLESRVDELEEYIEKLWNNCHITFYPTKNGYPIEHNPIAKKDGRGLIESELNNL